MTITVTTSVPAATFSTEGVTAPDEADVLSGVLADLKAALGGDMQTSLSTPQGQVAMALTALITDKNAQILAVVNQVNPDYAAGRFQDAIGKIYFLERNAATGTTVTATCTGAVGTVIPAGSSARDDSGYIYYSSSDATIGSDGSVDVVFTNGTTGAIACAAGTLNTIYVAVTGWSGITNSASGALGSDVESRANFEYRRAQSVARNANNTLASVYAAVLEVDGVTDAYVTENSTSVAASTGTSGYSIPAHCLYVAVYGGENADIASAIWNKKPPGVSMTGNTSATVQDSDNYVTPYPEYTITWVTPTAVDVYVKVEVQQSDSLSSTYQTSVKSAIVEAFNGEDGGNRARIGSTIFAGRYFSGVYAVDSDNMNIYSITLSRDGETWASSVSFGIDEIPVLSEDNITITESD